MKHLLFTIFRKLEHQISFFFAYVLLGLGVWFVYEEFFKIATSHKDLQSIQVNSDYIFLRFLKIYAESLEELKIYLNNNPIIYIYELVEPIYEDITPLQSSIVLKTFLESSMTIDTILPIETKLSYRTNVPSISTLSTRATELAESDNVIHNLMNIIDDEVDE